jgi:hypothetical protein
MTSFTLVQQLLVYPRYPRVAGVIVRESIDLAGGYASFDETT